MCMKNFTTCKGSIPRQMKKQFILFLILIIPLFLILIFNSFNSYIHLNYSDKIDFIEEIHIIGTADIKKADENNCIYKDKQKIQKILEYLDSIPLIKSDRSTKSFGSPNIFIGIYGKNKNPIETITVYEGGYIINTKSGRYESKWENIIRGIENIDF